MLARRSALAHDTSLVASSRRAPAAPLAPDSPSQSPSTRPTGSDAPPPPRPPPPSSGRGGRFQPYVNHRWSPPVPFPYPWSGGPDRQALIEFVARARRHVFVHSRVDLPTNLSSSPRAQTAVLELFSPLRSDTLAPTYSPWWWAHSLIDRASSESRSLTLGALFTEMARHWGGLQDPKAAASLLGNEYVNLLGAARGTRRRHQRLASRSPSPSLPPSSPPSLPPSSLPSSPQSDAPSSSSVSMENAVCPVINKLVSAMRPASTVPSPVRAPAVRRVTFAPMASIRTFEKHEEYDPDPATPPSNAFYDRLRQRSLVNSNFTVPRTSQQAVSSSTAVPSSQLPSYGFERRPESSHQTEDVVLGGVSVRICEGNCVDCFWSARTAILAKGASARPPPRGWDLVEREAFNALSSRLLGRPPVLRT